MGVTNKQNLIYWFLRARLAPAISAAPITVETKARIQASSKPELSTAIPKPSGAIMAPMRILVCSVAVAAPGSSGCCSITPKRSNPGHDQPIPKEMSAPMAMVVLVPIAKRIKAMDPTARHRETALYLSN